MNKPAQRAENAVHSIMSQLAKIERVSGKLTENQIHNIYEYLDTELGYSKDRALSDQSFKLSDDHE